MQEPIMFADDTKFFYPVNILKQFTKNWMKNLKRLVTGSWKISYPKITVKQKCTPFHKKISRRWFIFEVTSFIMIVDNDIERKAAIKILRVTLDESITWEEHIRTAEIKLAKNIGSLYPAKPLLHEESLKSIYFAYIYSYLNYASIGWASSYRSKLKIISLSSKTSCTYCL